MAPTEPQGPQQASLAGQPTDAGHQGSRSSARQPPARSDSARVKQLLVRMRAFDAGRLSRPHKRRASAGDASSGRGNKTPRRGSGRECAQSSNHAERLQLALSARTDESPRACAPSSAGTGQRTVCTTFPVWGTKVGCFYFGVADPDSVPPPPLHDAVAPAASVVTSAGESTALTVHYAGAARHKPAVQGWKSVDTTSDGAPELGHMSSVDTSVDVVSRLEGSGCAAAQCTSDAPRTRCDSGRNVVVDVEGILFGLESPSDAPISPDSLARRTVDGLGLWQGRGVSRIDRLWPHIIRGGFPTSSDP